MIPEYRVVFHPEAQRELAELYDYIAEQAGPVIAWDFISGIRTFCLKLLSKTRHRTHRASGGSAHNRIWKPCRNDDRVI